MADASAFAKFHSTLDSPVVFSTSHFLEVPGIFWIRSYALQRRQLVTSESVNGGEFRQLGLLRPNEVSGLLTAENEVLLETHRWDFALWAVLDEDRTENCVAITRHWLE